MEAIHHLIDGRIVRSTSGRSGPVFDPATGEETARVGFATTEEVDAAVAAASRAFPGWRATSVAARTKLLFRFRDLIGDPAGRDHARGIAHRMACSHGIPQLLSRLQQCRMELSRWRGPLRRQEIAPGR